MRAFIAVELPAEVRQALAALARGLAASRADVKWVEEDHLHLTVRFLGEITDEQRSAIEALLGRLTQAHGPVRLQLSDLGAFPSLSAPRILWVGVGQGAEELTRLAEAIEEGLGTLGLPREPRAFTAHITVGRARSPSNRSQLVDRMKALHWEPPAPFPVTHLTLFESHLTSMAAVYTALAKPAFGQSR